MTNIFGFCRSLLFQTYRNGLSYTVLSNVRTYKKRSSLKLRCSACRFVRRKGRLRVICKEKPRHKQRQWFNDWNKLIKQVNYVAKYKITKVFTVKMIERVQFRKIFVIHNPFHNLYIIIHNFCRRRKITGQQYSNVFPAANCMLKPSNKNTNVLIGKLNMFKLTIEIPDQCQLTLFHCLCCKLWTYSMHLSSY